MTDSGSGQGGEDRLTKIVRWFDSRLGLSHEMLRPVPQYALNPFYWLGALAVVAFMIQGVTGVLMMLYYVPSPAQAYSSTLYIFQMVSYGTFLETVHLYTAYAMIMLAFMHMMRGYFVSVHKRPREMMWLVGMGMGFVTLGFGFTGYLLPWTVVSKSATDVGVGMIDALPQPVSSFLSFLMIGAGGDAIELLRFYDLHVVVLPAVLLVLLAVKMYMLETHGISEPATGGPPTEKKKRLTPIFPDVSFYLLELAAVFGSAMLLISVVFPLSLPPQYTPQLAAQYVSQPDWYFLWIYQILKISVFEGPALPVALSLVTVIFLLLTFLPFIDRSGKKMIAQRRNYVTIGAVFIGELAVLAYWGIITPGKIIPAEQSVLVLGGTALIIALSTFAVYRMFAKVVRVPARDGIAGGHAPVEGKALANAQAWTNLCFVAILVAGSFGIGGSINSAVLLVMRGPETALLGSLAESLVLLSVSLAAAVYLLYRLDLGFGSIKRRVRAFEVGWNE